MKRGTLAIGLTWLMLTAASASVEAVAITLTPGDVSGEVGSDIVVAIGVADAGAFFSPSVAAYDITVAFDPLAITFVGAEYGDPLLGDQLDVLGLGSITSTTASAATVNLFQLSLDTPSDLDLLQQADFVLARLRFAIERLGTSELTISSALVSDTLGNPLTADAPSGVTVTGTQASAPEPAALVLTGGAVIAVLLRRRRGC